MALPDVKINITDPNLGISPSAEDVSAAVGVCSSGAVGTLYSFGDKQTVKDTLGYGPLTEYIAHLLDVAGGPVYAVKVTGSVPGTTGAVTRTGTGPAITAAGAAYDSCDVVVVITGGGILGAGTFKFSLDGGENFSPDIVIPAGGSYALSEINVTLTFPAGTYVLNDNYTLSTVAPGFAATDLNTALDTLTADPREWRFVKVVGQASTAAASKTIADAISTKLAAMTSAYRYTRAFLDAADDTDANLISAFAAYADGRVLVAAGMERLISSISGRKYKRPIGWSAASRAAKAPVHEDLGRVASGSQPGVASLVRDERVTPGLDAQRFTTGRSIVGLPGLYITTGRTMATQISDFQYIQNGFVIDRACRAARYALMKYLNDSVRVDATTGKILEVEAQRIEAEVDAAVEDAVVSPGNATGVEVVVDRTGNILSTGALSATISVIPFGYLRSISANVGLKNPALTPVAAQ